MTSSITAGASPASASRAGAVAPARIRIGVVGFALAWLVAGAALGAIATAAQTASTAQARVEVLVERLEHARRVDDLRNQQHRWAR